MTDVQSSLIGKAVIIKVKNHTDYGNWGIVKSFDGEDYFVAMNDDDKAVLTFTRSEFKLAGFDPRSKGSFYENS